MENNNKKFCSFGITPFIKNSIIVFTKTMNKKVENPEKIPRIENINILT
ncbi:MAG: hypothetical protein HRT68_16645 [Flavobacteriaceae bacterium]|nr:hypothetical protein [Flavobacteriaceae bacterium]